MTEHLSATLTGFNLTEPSPDEAARGAERLLEPIRDLALDALPEDVQALMPPTRGVPLPPVSEFQGIWHGEQSVALVEALRPLFDGKPYFFKLSFRSPKESHWIGQGIQTWCAEQAVERMAVSERCLDDCVLYDPSPTFTHKAFVREWQPYMPEDEVRCFVKDGNLIAVSQYAPSPDARWENAKFRQGIRKRVEHFWQHRLHPAMHTESYVFDVCFGWADDGLIEINPYGLSDPCALGSYESVEAFDGYVAYYPTGGRS